MLFGCLPLQEISLCCRTINTLRPRQNGRRFADDTFKCIFLNENVRISIKISLKFVPKGPINNNPALVQIMAWRRSGDKPLSEPMMVSLLTHLCVTRPQWVNNNRSFLVLVMDWCAEQTILSLTWESPYLGKTAFILRWGPAYPSTQWILSDISRVSCKKGPTRHAYAWQIGPFSQDTLDIFSSTHQSSSFFLSIMPSYSGHAAFRYAYLMLAFTNTSRQPIHQNGASIYWQLFFSQTIEIRINSLLSQRCDNNFKSSQRSSCEESVSMSWCHHAIKV